MVPRNIIKNKYVTSLLSKPGQGLYILLREGGTGSLDFLSSATALYETCNIRKLNMVHTFQARVSESHRHGL